MLLEITVTGKLRHLTIYVKSTYFYGIYCGDSTPFKNNVAICNNASSSTLLRWNYAILKYASTMQTYLRDGVLGMENLWEIWICDLSSNT